MADELVSTGDRSELTGIIRDIRKRWRLKLAVRGAAFVVAGFLLTLLLSAYALETPQVQPRVDHRVPRRHGHDFRRARGLLLRSAAMAPRHRRTGGACIWKSASPSLETAILSALEAEKGSSSHSPELARRLVEQAIERCGTSSGPPAGGAASAALCDRDRRHRRGGASSLRSRAGISAPGRLGAAAHGRRAARSRARTAST